MIVLLLFSHVSYSETIYFLQKSHHVSCSPGEDGCLIKRESHALLIYENNHRYMMGYWRNSLDKDSFGIGKNFHVMTVQDIEVRVKMGLATGYPWPVFGSISVGYGYLDVNWLPGEVLTAGFQFKF